MKEHAATLLSEFQNSFNDKLSYNQKIIFRGVGNKDVYNISAPFVSAGHIILAGRVEERDSEFSTIMFFKPAAHGWEPIKQAPSYALQDPFFTHIQGELILGGVEVTPVDGDPHRLTWRTKFLKGRDIFSLKDWCYGPNQMKDLRLAELNNGEIIVFTRPQGKKGGRGQIGLIKLSNLEQFNEQSIESAPLLDLFYDEEWGGVNEIHLLNDHQVGLLSHIAQFDDDGNRHYYPMVFTVDLVTMQPSKMKIIFERSLLPGDASKRDDLIDVIFSGGLVRHSNGLATLYAGVSDAVAYQITLPDPFL